MPYRLLSADYDSAVALFLGLQCFTYCALSIKIHFLLPPGRIRLFLTLHHHALYVMFDSIPYPLGIETNSNLTKYVDIDILVKSGTKETWVTIDTIANATGVILSIIPLYGENIMNLTLNGNIPTYILNPNTYGRIGVTLTQNVTNDTYISVRIAYV